MDGFQIFTYIYCLINDKKADFQDRVPASDVRQQQLSLLINHQFFAMVPGLRHVFVGLIPVPLSTSIRSCVLQNVKELFCL
jgi:hypothetical protein